MAVETHTHDWLIFEVGLAILADGGLDVRKEAMWGNPAFLDVLNL